MWLVNLSVSLVEYISVKCLKTDCGVVNCVPYGKTHRMKKKKKKTVWDAVLGC